MKTYLIITSIFFCLAGAVHIVRLILGWQITVNGWAIPLWVSIAAAPVCSALCICGISLFVKASPRVV